MAPIVFSLGYRCSSAGVLKRLNQKTESYPFDWLVSRLPIVEHCMETDFQEFLNPDNYEELRTNTYHYATPHSDPQWICEERIQWNRHYSTIPNSHLYIPSYLSKERDAYAYPFLINHKNIADPIDHEYYKRCVARWRNMMQSPEAKRGLYIHPVLNTEEYTPISVELLDEIRRFHGSVAIPHFHGIYVFPVRTDTESPIETIYQEGTITVAVLWTNRDFIDAGEIFMGNHGAEEAHLCEWIHHKIHEHA